MEENVAKLIQEQLPNVNHFTGELFQNKTPNQDDRDAEIPKQSLDFAFQDLAEEEESLRLYLDKLKKENFTLRTSIKAWQTTLETKLDEFKKADLKLEELYNEIWSEREKFCSKLDKFNDEYGILSGWWEMQVRFVTELESTGEKTPEDEKCKQEVKNLEKEIEELKKKVEELQQAKKQRTETPATAEGDSLSPRTEKKVDSPKQATKKVKFSEVVQEYNIGRRGGDPASDLYSVVDLEKVKNAKRRRRNSFLGRDKKVPQTSKH